MTGFDYAVMAIVGFSVLLSILRGLTQEILSLLFWVLALWSAGQYADQLSVLLPLETTTPETRILIAFIAILVTVWLVTLLIKLVVARFINIAGLNVLDRLLGSLFGLARGSLFVLLLVLAAGLTKFPQLPMWRNAMFSEVFVSAARATLPWLPPTLANKIHY
jgi:membrane protein required for colicin V production